MTAKVFPVGKVAHDAERQALAFLVQGLPESYTVYTNSWIAERDGSVFELDAVVVAPHAVFVVEIKGYRGAIRGTDHDWLIPEPRPSPLRLNRLTAQVLKSEVRRRSAAAGRVWVEGFVFLSHTTDVALNGTASQARVHTRESVLPALQDTNFLRNQLTRGQLPEAVDAHARGVVHELLTGADPRRKPVRRVREWEVGSVLARGEDYIEYEAQHDMMPRDGSSPERLLRVYPLPWMVSDEERRRINDRCTWEAQVLATVGSHPFIVDAEPPFREEIGVCLPMERFRGVSLASWCERHLAEGTTWPALGERLEIWRKVALAVHFAHTQGVVHRLLRPEVILVEDTPTRPDVRLTGFELAKRVERAATVASTALDEARAVWAAPEIVRDFHDAEPRSDQFSLGALFGLLATGKALFGSTTELLRRGGQPPHLHDLDPRLPKALDACAGRMLALRPADRYDSVADAVRAVAEVRGRQAATAAGTAAVAPRAAPLDADDLAPGTRLGTDYEVVQRVGRGGMGAVYKVRHLLSGQFRALKVARASDAAEEALRSEYDLLREVDHPAIVRALDLSGAVPDRVSLVLDWVEGVPLPKWLDAHREPELAMLRRFADDLLDALDYLQALDVVHKDIKPDNLLLGPRGLTLIDFSLVAHPPESIAIGTSLYRDPALQAWDAAADRYAAALCLFELFVGAHAFDGQVPPPDRAVALDEDEVQPKAMAGFLRRALDPDRDKRFASLAEMRQALRQALGAAGGEAPAPRIDVAAIVPEAGRPLDTTFLSRGSLNALRRGWVRTQGQLVGADPDMLQRLRNVGRTRLQEIVALREALMARGVPAEMPFVAPTPAPIAPRWVADPRPVAVLPLSEGLKSELVRGGFDTVGRLAQASEAELLGVPWLGAVKLQRIVQVLDALGQTAVEEAPGAPASLDEAMARAMARLTDRQAEVLRLMSGSVGAPPTQTAVAQQLGVTRQAVNLQYHEALKRLDVGPLAAVHGAVQAALDAAGGLLPLGDAVRAVVEAIPTEDEGLALLAIRLVAVHDAAASRARLIEGLAAQREGVIARVVPETDDTRPSLDVDAVGRFLAEAFELAAWPPKAAEGARRALGVLLPDYAGDAVALAARLGEGLHLTPAGELFASPVTVAQAVPYLLQGEPLPLTLARLGQRAHDVFGDAVAWPGAAELAVVVAGLDLGDVRLDGEALVLAPPAGVVPAAAVEDAPPEFLIAPERRPEEVAGDLLRAAAVKGHWRLVVTPPARHRELGRNVARALGAGATFISFEERLLARLEPDFEAFERAERFVAMRPKLTAAAEQLLDELLREHGQPGAQVVLGDTAVLQVCAAQHLVNRVYDATLSGGRGFWAVVVPGIIYERTPLFNERDPLPWIEGSVLPLRDAIPVAA